VNVDPNVLVQIDHLRKGFPIRRGLLQRTVGHIWAVNGISLSIQKGETFGLVGESGSGKSTLGRCILRLDEPTSGKVLFEGEDVLALDRSALRRRRRDMQIIFQDPYASLNPRMTVGTIVGEPFAIHKIAKGKEREERVAALLKRVGLDASAMRRYPHEFSGGQRQRVGIARAIALNPKFVVCDEPVSALDVSVQAQVVNLLKDLQEELGLTYLFIAHGLQVVRHISDRVAVMYLGRIMEAGPTEEAYRAPLHPYTKALLEAAPEPVPGADRVRTVLKGEVPSPANPPPGCVFHTRCPLAEPRCRAEIPALRDFGQGRTVACHLAAQGIPGELG
jgi:oligopeptide transport system ATP-binding protein